MSEFIFAEVSADSYYMKEMVEALTDPHNMAEEVEVKLDRERQLARIKKFLPYLKQYERAVIVLKFGLYDGTEYTLKQVSQLIAISERYAKECLSSGLTKLRKWLKPDPPQDDESDLKDIGLEPELAHYIDPDHPVHQARLNFIKYLLNG